MKKTFAKNSFVILVNCIFGLLLLAPQGVADVSKSQLNNDPEVYYFSRDKSDSAIFFTVAKNTKIFRDKNAKSLIKTIRKGDKVQLIAMSDRAYRIKGGGTYNGYIGWVNPHHMTSKDPDFIPKLKAFHAREIQVAKLIENNEIAIGMTEDEVSRSLGEPTKTSAEVTAKGRTTRWQFIQYEEQNHYEMVRDFRTGNLYRRFSHTTLEEVGKCEVDFANGLVASFKHEEQANAPSRPKIITRPIIFAW